MLILKKAKTFPASTSGRLAFVSIWIAPYRPTLLRHKLSQQVKKHHADRGGYLLRQPVHPSRAGAQAPRPPPSYMPCEAGLMWCLSRWTDGELFTLAVKLVLGSAGENLPQDFAQDRGRLYLGENWAEGLKTANAELPHIVSQVRAPLSWLNSQLGDGRDFLLGADPAAIDAQSVGIERSADDVGRVCVYFPRAGYRIATG